MKPDWSHIDQFRKLSGPYASKPGDNFGAFFFRRATTDLIVIASSGDESVPWEHISARARDWTKERTPTWVEMCWLKDLFWGEEECVVQYHPPKSEYVNNHPHVLHMWRPTAAEMPRPPAIAVGVKSASSLMG